MPESRAEDPYHRLSYRRLIAWPARIEREWPFLAAQLRRAPEASVLDLGCGTGEHALELAARGYRAVGIDRSEEQIGQARDYEGRHGERGPRFLLGDFCEPAALGGERFGAAICLGNVLPHLEDDALAGALAAWAGALLPGGRLLFQIVNYRRIRARGIRHLPLNFRDEPKRPGEIVFLRFITPDGDRHMLFHPCTLALRPGEERPVELMAAKEVRLRSWTRSELEPPLAAAGFQVEAVHGDMEGGPFEPESSADLVMVAVLAAGSA